MENKPQN